MTSVNEKTRRRRRHEKKVVGIVKSIVLNELNEEYGEAMIIFEVFIENI